MAAVVATADMTIQKNSQILVNVEEALTDLLVVSYCTEDKKFQGVLLDSSKGNLPFGVYSLHPAFIKKTETNDKNDDNLHSVSQRFTYQEPQYADEDVQKSRKHGNKGKPQPRQKMTVRLRPRKVLCSNCKGICNENNENVDVSKKRKLDCDDDIPQDGSVSSKVEKKHLMKNMLVPKLSRLETNEASDVKPINTNERKARSVKNEKSTESENSTRELAFVSVSDGVDICDENDLKEDNDTSFSSLFSSARTLKICFGEGEGTVVKIPPLSGDFNEDSGVSCDMGKPSKPDSKAVKKALKKAKKQAKRNNVLEKEDETNQQSLKHVGALSPHNNMPDNPPNDPLEKKHRHKMKHKKKRRVTKKCDENSSKSDNDGIDYFSNIKDHCLKQKLSISLRRLSSNSYEKRNEQETDASDDCESETVPDFPANTTESIGGQMLRVSPGDIVWGKVVGFPWWPGRVISVTSASRAHIAWFASSTSSLMPCDSLSPFLEDYKEMLSHNPQPATPNPIASTSKQNLSNNESCIRFNKKKRGPYKEAVKQATMEARRNESHMDPLASPTHPNLATVSPRPIDVFS